MYEGDEPPREMIQINWDDAIGPLDGTTHPIGSGGQDRNYTACLESR